MGFCSEETLEDIALTSEAYKPKYKTLIPGNGISKPSEQAIINLILPKTYSFAKKKHEAEHNVLRQYGFFATESMKQV